MKKVLFGAEPYSIDQKVKEFTTGLGDMGIARFPSLSDEAFQAAEVYPMFTARQVVIVELDKLGACEELVKAKIPEFTDFMKTDSLRGFRMQNRNFLRAARFA